MKILEDLADAHGFTSFFGLTYGADLGWFEGLLLGSLRTNGVRRITLLTDPKPLSATLASQMSDLSGAGRSYIVQAIPCSASFHPKAFLLTGEETARLYVGSGNLGSAGLNRNLELFERWDISAGDPTAPTAFSAFRWYVDKLLAKLLPRVPAHLAAALDAAFGAKVLTEKTYTDQRRPEPELIGSPEALLDRLPKPDSPASRVVLAAPFFDEEGEAAVQIARRLRTRRFDVITDRSMTNLTSGAGDAIRKAGGRLFFWEHDEPVHAKLLYAEGKGWQLGVHGSANLSLAAWRGLNAELVVVRRGTIAREVEKLIDGVNRTEIDEDEWQQLDRRARKRKEEDALARATGPSPALQIEDARWDGFDILIVTKNAKNAEAAEILTRGDTLPAKLRTRATMELAVTAADAMPDRVTAVRLLGGGRVGPWCLAHDRLELHLHARPRTRDDTRLEHLFGADPADPDAAWALNEFLGQIYSNRLERKREHEESTETSGPNSNPDDAGDKPRWTWVPDNVSLTPVPGEPLPPGPLGSLEASPTWLMRHLLLGANDAECDTEEGESDQQDEPTWTPREKAPPTSRRQLAAAEPRAEFFDAAENVRVIYLRALAQGQAVHRDVFRLAEDLQLLCFSLQRALRAGYLDTQRFCALHARVLREMLGSGSSPLPAALSRLEEDERLRAWTQMPFLSLAGILIFKSLLPDLDLRSNAVEEHRHLDAALWIRNILRSAPVPTAELLALAEKQLPRLRRNGLWLADEWPDAEFRCPFLAFLTRVTADAAAVESLEQAIGPRLREVTSANSGEAEDDESVLGWGRDGHLAIGFVEQSGLARIAFLADGAFQKPRGQGSESRSAPMLEVSHRRVVPLDKAATWIEGCSSEVRAGLEVFRRLS